MAVKKIFLSPSEQFANAYASGGTNEGAQMGMLAELVEERLKKRGFLVKTLHRETMAYKVATADSWGADLYVCLHSNAYDRKTGGTRIFYWSKSSEGYKAGLRIFDRLAPLTPGTSDAMKQDQSLYEIRNPEAPVVYVEVEFHDVAAYAKWIVEHLPEIADAIVRGICDFYGVTYSSKYSVCLGHYSTRAEAENALKNISITEMEE